jgi:DNA-binding response OmpR family regulator
MKHVIIADDDPGIQDVVALILERYGYQPEIHANGKRLLANDFKEPKLFIIDKQLEHEDGLDVCRFLKSRKKVNTPVIIFSATQKFAKEALAAGADAFLEKPFDIKTLVDLSNRLIAEAEAS